LYSRCRTPPCCLPVSPTPSAPWFRIFRSSIACPHIPLSNASSASLRPALAWLGARVVATPSLYDFSIHCSAPVYPDAIRTHAPNPTGSPRLRLCVSFEESLQVATSPCCQRALPDVISENLSCDAWAPITTVCRVHIPVSSPATAAFPTEKLGRLTVRFRLSDFPAGRNFGTAAISLCSGLAICLPPWSLLPLQFPAGQLMTFTSGQNVLRYLHTHRIC
jgi:hypothetical protein